METVGRAKNPVAAIETFDLFVSQINGNNSGTRQKDNRKAFDLFVSQINGNWLNTPERVNVSNFRLIRKSN